MKRSVEIDGHLFEVAVGRNCVVCEKSEMAIYRRSTRGADETQHLQCPRCGNSAHRMVNTVSGVVVRDSDHQ
jgi:DNA-directed RNA polymerase subunit M/transcription elongation factor TFIIS